VLSEILRKLFVYQPASSAQNVEPCFFFPTAPSITAEYSEMFFEHLNINTTHPPPAFSVWLYYI